MAVSKDNTRILVTVTKEQKELLEALARMDKRSVSNFCYKILSLYLDNVKRGDSI